ncbi:KH domain containing protein [Nitzschia inconspicua]|uniref:KH domain containing protein n=1 Tax=Nitzschia inconspicua TaxID=303405 RepID=A0A9K3LK30_9STRA|nr:KH domain containing protein [Nitzschia inconspicua]
MSSTTSSGDTIPLNDIDSIDNNNMNFLTTYGSHMAGVVIGVVVTLAMVGTMRSGGSSSPSSTTGGSGTTTANSSSNNNNNNNNKKKKKRSKKTGTEITTTTTTNNNSKSNSKSNSNRQKTIQIIVEPSVQHHQDDDDDDDDDDKMKMTLSDTKTQQQQQSSNGNNNNNQKKKKNNKKKKNGTATTNGTTTTNNVVANNVLPKQQQQQEEQQHKQQQQQEEQDFTNNGYGYGYDYYDPKQLRQQEEVWEVIPNNKSKKKKNNKTNNNNNNNKAPSATAVNGTTASSSASTTAPTTATTTTTVTEVVSIDATKVGIIIGPKGSTMTAISAATGCKLDVDAPPKDVKPNPRSTKLLQATVVISQGTSENVAKAKRAVLELAANGYATLLQADTFGEQSLSVHPRVLSQIVGPGGRTIQAIQTSLNVKITIPKTDWKPNMPQIGNIPPSCKVGIAGDDRANVKQAKQVLQYLLKYHHHEITHPGMIHQEVYVPQEFFHCVIGPRGSEIKHIRGNFKVDVYMPTSDGHSENVLVVGNPNNVEKAVRYIELLMERDTEQRAQKYSDEYYG